MSVEDSECRRLELNIRMRFSEADLGPTSAADLLLSRFSKKLELSVSKVVLIGRKLWYHVVAVSS